jgi:hypothetical protein
MANWMYPIAWLTGIAIGGWVVGMSDEMVIGGLTGCLVTSIMAYHAWVK